MPTDRIRGQLAGSGSRRSGALLPYVTAGFPDSLTTEKLILAADAAGAACIEVGIPFSDSIADGPVIQASFHSALSRGWTLDDTLQAVSRIRPSVNCGLVAMVSYTLVYRQGIDPFFDRAAAAGFDGVILPDVPVEEAAPMKAAADNVGLDFIGMVAPNTESSRREAIVRQASGFIYQIAVAGTTGERAGLPRGLAHDVRRLRKLSELPVCVGFGISTPEHVRAVCDLVDGAIVGSAIVRRIADEVRKGSEPDTIVQQVSGFIGELMTGVASTST